MTTIINADNGVSSGVAGLKTSADNSGVLALQTNGTTAVTVDASQNVGIGTTSPATKLDVNGTARVRAGNILYFGNAASDANANMYASGGSGNSSLSINNGAGSVLIGTATEVSGGGCLQVANGITFPATQSASSNANTLDDYEEGTWTPAPVSLTVVGTPTYTGKYTKIGNQVTCWATIDSTTSTTASGGSTSIGGLPFTASAISGSSSGAGTSISSNGVNQVGGGYIFTGNNRFYVSGWTATANIVLSITYQV